MPRWTACECSRALMSLCDINWHNSRNGKRKKLGIRRPTPASRRCPYLIDRYYYISFLSNLNMEPIFNLLAMAHVISLCPSTVACPFFPAALFGENIFFKLITIFFARACKRPPVLRPSRMRAQFFPLIRFLITPIAYVRVGCGYRTREKFLVSTLFRARVCALGNFDVRLIYDILPRSEIK